MFRGIAVFIHWTFFLLLAWVAFDSWREQGLWISVGREVVMVLLVFACVLLHEFGHALMAARYQVKTRDITLLPIGGVARLEHMPEKPREEFMIAVAGPCVNLVIIVLLLPFILWRLGWPLSFDPADTDMNGVLVNLLMVNVSLLLFNLIPAFPMDGGRMLRSLLSMKFSRSRATTIAAITGMVLASFFVVLGWYFNPVLALIGLFVFFSARSELQMVQKKQSGAIVAVSEIARDDFMLVRPDMLLQDAFEQVCGSQSGGLITGSAGQGWAVLTAVELAQAFSLAGGSRLLSELPLTYSRGVECSMPASLVLDKMYTMGAEVLPVVNNQQCVGVAMRRDLEWLGKIAGLL